MNQAKVFIILFFTLLAFPSFSLVIHIAPVEYLTAEDAGQAPQPVEIQSLLTSQLFARFGWDRISFEALEVPPPRSFLDAIKTCDERELDYLLYGFIEEQKFSLYGELKLFDRQRGEVVRAFYSGDNVGQLARLIGDLSGKVGDYFADLFDLSPDAENKPVPEEGIVSLALGCGYWAPLTEQWSDYIQSLYSLSLQIRFTPWRPVDGGFYFKTGVSAGLYQSMNKPGYEESQLFNITLGIPLSLCLDLGIRHTMGLSLEPQISIDYLIRKSLYGDTIRTRTLLFSGSADLEYQFHITKSFSLGVGNRGAVQFLNPLRIEYNPFLFCEVKLNTKKGNNKK